MMTIKDKINAICESMATWDHEELLGWAQDARREMLKFNPEVVDEEYEQACGEAPAAVETRTVLLPDGREVPAERCACGDGSCAACDDDGWVPVAGAAPSEARECPNCGSMNVYDHPEPADGHECHDCGAEWNHLTYPTA